MVSQNSGRIIKKNVLGHLGRVFKTHAYTHEKEKNQRNNKKHIHTKGFNIPVPSVPTTETVSKACDVTTETEAPPTVNCSSSKCSFRAIPYLDSSGKYIVDKCNVHGERLKVTHAEIDAWSREKERKNSRPHGDIQSKTTF